MASLNFNRAIKISEQAGSHHVENLVIGNEPSNNIYQYYANSHIAGDKMATIALSNYNLTWSNEIRSITSQRVSRLGVKTFPQIGAIGFYVSYTDSRSFILAPVHSESDRTDRPTLTMSVSTNSITFTITADEQQDYICYRIVMRLNLFAIEYVTYETTLTVDLPTDTGTYDIYCVGYINEGAAVSADSTHITQHIEGTGEPEDDTYVNIIGASFDRNGYLVLRRSDGTVVTSDNTFISQYDELEALSRIIGVYPDSYVVSQETNNIIGGEDNGD